MEVSSFLLLLCFKPEIFDLIMQISLRREVESRDDILFRPVTYGLSFLLDLALFQGSFFGFSVFPPSFLKKQHFQIPVRPVKDPHENQKVLQC